MKKLFIALFPVLFLFACEKNKTDTSAKNESVNDSTAIAQAGIFKPANIQEQIVYNRAIEAVNWGMPMVNYDRMFQAMVNAKGATNQIVFWSRLPDWKNQTLTPNPDVIYLMPFFNTKEVGPIVLEIPSAEGGTIVGSVMDCWQTAIEDVGPAGVDKGKGGKYLILPPNYKEKIPNGYIAMPSDTYQGYALLRSVLKSGSDKDVAAAIYYAKHIKFYPLSTSANPHQTAFVDVVNMVFDSTIPYDLRFFQSLNNMVQSDVTLTRDKIMIDVLKSIGIEKGKSFSPDARTQEILKLAILAAHKWIDSRYDAIFTPSYFDRTHWALPASKELIAGIESNYTTPDKYPVGDRGLAYSYAFFSTKHIGEGQFYLMTIKDKDGQSFKGIENYHLNVPANAPVKLYWSATVYNRLTHALIRDLKWSNRSSQTPGIQKNADGSVDIYFGPKAPDGNESNWIPIDAKGEFEVLFRFYGPEKPLFDKTWKMDDIEKVK